MKRSLESVNIENRYACFSAQAEEPLELEDYAEYVLACTPGVGANLARLQRLGLDESYSKRTRAKLRRFGFQHNFYYAVDRGCQTVTSVEPVSREVAELQFRNGLHVLPLQRGAGERFMITPRVWVDCYAALSPRFSKCAFGAYFLTLKSLTEYWTAEELQRRWGCGRARTYRLMRALVKLGYLKKIKSRSAYKFIPEKAYRAQFAKKMRKRQAEAVAQEGTATLASGISDGSLNSEQGESSRIEERKTRDVVKSELMRCEMQAQISCG